MTFIETLENAIGKKAKKNMLPMQAGDVAATYADVADLQSAVGFSPSTELKDGFKAYIDWYRSYYGERSA
jgi:UDP-glucuronate 4-epimerase